MKKLSYFISLISVSLLLLLSCDTPMESSEVSLLEQSESNSLMKTNKKKRIIHGMVDKSGNIIAGSGFRVSIVGPFPDAYKVTFDRPFSSQPTVTATGIGLGGNVTIAWIFDDFTPNSFTLRLNSSGAKGFSFIAIGAR